MDFGKPLRKKNLRKGMTPVIAQKVSRRDLRLINCLIVFEMKRLPQKSKSFFINCYGKTENHIWCLSTA